MALVRKEAGKRQDEVSRGALPPLEDGNRIMLPPKNWGEGRLGWRCLADTLHLPEGLGWGRVRKSDLSFAPTPEMTSLLPFHSQPQDPLSDLLIPWPFSGWDTSLLLPVMSPKVIHKKQELKGVVQPSWQKHLWV